MITGGDNPPVERYLHDAHGNMTRMPHLGGADPSPNLYWDHRDQLQRTDRGGGTAYYVYDAAGQRVRKVWEKPADIVEERIYLGGFEIYRRRRQGAQSARAGDSARHGRQAARRPSGDSHARHGGRRRRVGAACPLPATATTSVRPCSSWTIKHRSSPTRSTRPTAARPTRPSQPDETPKRYRFTGKERDEETGFGLPRALLRSVARTVDERRPGRDGRRSESLLLRPEQPDKV